MGQLVAVVVRPSRVLDRIGAEIARAVDLLSQSLRCPGCLRSVSATRTTLKRRSPSSDAVARRPVLLGGGYDLGDHDARCSRAARRSLACGCIRSSSRLVLACPFSSVPYDPKNHLRSARVCTIRCRRCNPATRTRLSIRYGRHDLRSARIKEGAAAQAVARVQGLRLAAERSWKVPSRDGGNKIAHAFSWDVERWPHCRHRDRHSSELACHLRPLRVVGNRCGALFFT